MKTVYMVSSGEYSDYGVDCIFENKEYAEEYVAIQNSNNRSRYDQHRVEEIQILDEIPVRIDRWNYYGKFGFYSDKNFDDPIEPYHHYIWSHQGGISPERPEVNVIETKAGEIIISGSCRNRESLVKAIADKIAQIKADRAGIT